MNPGTAYAGQLPTDRHGRGRSRATGKPFDARRWLASAVVAPLAVAGASGCRPTGTWRLAETYPPGAAFPLRELALDASGHFAATSTAYGERIRSQGAYRWKGSTLEVGRAGFEPRSYSIKRHWDGRLEFIHHENGRRVSAFFERIDPRETSAPVEADEPGTTAETAPVTGVPPKPPGS